ncbi:MAG: NeuD/PglB/VioB family sugar acetyltransferase [Thermoleophilia bacterium]|nr:NeuD/PglB/VioB family sugar acetyltransferase [Gaiellaceae bacterium]MDW8338386.1 NeuD/PglB/VioB family sugar acetyltransferase [Thermoleophilia bacterium]
MKPLARIEIPLVNPNEPEVQVIEIGVEPFSRVARGDLVCVVETSKATADVVAEVDGWIGALHVSIGERASAGDLVCEVFAERPEPEAYAAARHEARRPEGVRLTRKAERLAREAGLDLETLPRGRFLTEGDIELILGRGRTAREIPEAIRARVSPRAAVIFGAGGLAKSLVELLRADGTIEPVCALTDRPEAASDVLGVPVLGGREYLRPLRELGIPNAVNAVGALRRIEDRIRVAEALAGAGFAQPALVDPAASVAPSATLAEGALVFPGAAVCAAARVGVGTIVNTNAVVSHDCVLGDFVHVAPGALLAGEVEVGRGTLIGMGVTVLVSVRIGANVIIGNGAVVSADVPEGTIVHAGGVWPRSEHGR